MHGNCQRCRQPLTPSSLDESLAALTRSTYDLLSQSERRPLPINVTTTTTTTSGNLSRLAPSLRPLYNAAAGRQHGFAPSTSTSSAPLPLPPPPPPPSSSRTPGHLRSLSSTSTTTTTTLTNTLRVPSPYQPTHNAILNPALGPGESYIVLDTAQRPPHSSTTSSPTFQSNHHTSNPSLDSPSSTLDPTPLTPRISQLTHLYSLLSAESSLDHPLCTECMDQLLVMMHKELEELRKEKDRLEAFDKDVQRRRNEDQAAGSGSGSSGGGKEALIKEIAKRKKAAQDALEELKAVEAERAALDQEKALLDAEEQQLALEEQEFWRDHSNHLLEAQAMQDRLDSVQTRYDHDLRELIKLEKTNVFNDAFCIGQDAGFGTINGLRLGRLPHIVVEWPEINAAWGHTLLLLHTMARKFSYSFETYKLVPVGSFSRIEKVGGDQAALELYGSGDFAVTRLLQNRRFDMAMVAFLECLRQLIEYVGEKDKAFKVPHLVVKDKIGDVSIKLQFGSDETWTRALRHVLLDLKILLGRASM